MHNQSMASCYRNYFAQPYKLCPDYFKNTFSSFVRNNLSTTLVFKSGEGLPMYDRYLMVFDNSLSKKEMLDESDQPVKTRFEASFTLNSFGDYHSHVRSSRLLLHSVDILRADDCHSDLHGHLPALSAVQTLQERERLHRGGRRGELSLQHIIRLIRQGRFDTK